MALEERSKLKIIGLSVIGVALLVGAGFGISYLIKKSNAKKAGGETSTGGENPRAVPVGKVDEVALPKGVTPKGVGAVKSPVVGGRPNAVLATQGRG